MTGWSRRSMNCARSSEDAQARKLAEHVVSPTLALGQPVTRDVEAVTAGVARGRGWTTATGRQDSAVRAFCTGLPRSTTTRTSGRTDTVSPTFRSGRLGPVIHRTGTTSAASGGGSSDTYILARASSRSHTVWQSHSPGRQPARRTRMFCWASEPRPDRISIFCSTEKASRLSGSRRRANAR